MKRTHFLRKLPEIGIKVEFLVVFQENEVFVLVLICPVSEASSGQIDTRTKTSHFL